jgi:hypothetical protein
LIYVDDIIITGNHHATINALITTLRLNFAMKDLGALSYFLSIQVLRDHNGIHLKQSKYMQDLLTWVHMAESKPYRVPCVVGTKMSKFESDILPDPTEYRHIVGSLQYVTLTQPNIAYLVNQLCQHMHNPTSVHFIATKRVLRYLKAQSTMASITAKVHSPSMHIVMLIGQAILMTSAPTLGMAFS